MISYKPAGDEHFDELMEVIFHQKTPWLKPILDLNQISWNQFGRLFRTTGTVYQILVDGCLAGLCWVEVCDRVLHLHGLIMKPDYQGKGIGTQTLTWLDELFHRDIDAIELIVHASNRRAKALYERNGFQKVGAPNSSGFYTLRKLCKTQTVQEDVAMEIPVGKVTHFFNHLGVAVIRLSEGIKLGDTIYILGRITEFEQPVSSLEINHHKVTRADAGTVVALKVIDTVRRGDLVFRVSEPEVSLMRD